FNIRGALSMANAGADTNGSQFFINQNSDDQTSKISQSDYPEKIFQAYKKGGNPSLDGSYTVFGQVISGMKVVDEIADQKVTDNGSGEKSKPVDPVKVTSIDVVKEAK
ncbi:MAG: peptidylprolyl isomerase, partial [Weissella cibaria]